MVRRADLETEFGISTPQASVDFRAFKKLNPGAMRYDGTLKGYVPDAIEVAQTPGSADSAKEDQAIVDSWVARNGRVPLSFDDLRSLVSLARGFGPCAHLFGHGGKKED